ncbi:hypothetical protein HNV12_01910 [Methanococcoides sp. SA1]|nr:hypothetical protein [Methanococcoides sp. SA1]
MMGMGDGRGYSSEDLGGLVFDFDEDLGDDSLFDEFDCLDPKLKSILCELTEIAKSYDVLRDKNKSGGLISKVPSNIFTPSILHETALARWAGFDVKISGVAAEYGSGDWNGIRNRVSRKIWSYVWDL